MNGGKKNRGDREPEQTCIQKGFFTALPFLLPSLVGFLVFSILPMLTSMAVSFTEWGGLKKLTLFSDIGAFFGDYGIGFENYAAILKSREFWQVLVHTLYFCALYLPVMLAVSIGVAVILNSKMKGVGVFRVVYYIPVLTSWVAGALIWRWVLSPDYGVVNSILGFFGIEGPKWLYDKYLAMPSIVMASVWKDLGYFGLIFLGGLQTIDPAVYEAASVDGAGRWRQFFKITLPLLTPFIFFVVIIALMNSFQIFPQVVIMTGGGPNGATEVLVERIYTYAFSYKMMGYASAYSWILFFIIFIFTMLQFKFQRKWVNYDR